MTPLADVVVALAQALRAAGIPHAFGGALALAYYTEEPRGTRDVDVNVFLTTDQVEALAAALPPEVAWPDGARRDLARDGQVRLWWEGETPVDLFLSTHDFHDEAELRTVTVPFAGVDIAILDATTLTVFKALFDRTKDWADIEAMAEAGAIDGSRARAWLDQLLGTDDARAARLARTLDRPPNSEPA